MQHNREVKKRLDYQIFNRTGEKVEKSGVEGRLLDLGEEIPEKSNEDEKVFSVDTSAETMHIAAEKGKLILQLESLCNNIDDFVEENPFTNCNILFTIYFRVNR